MTCAKAAIHRKAPNRISGAESKPSGRAAFKQRESRDAEHRRR